MEVCDGRDRKNVDPDVLSSRLLHLSNMQHYTLYFGFMLQSAYFMV